MLTTNVEENTPRVSAESSGPSSVTSDPASQGSKHSRLAKALTIEWLGQTVASICWIASMFTYGISSTGDWLQLMAASAWFVANVASLMSSNADRPAMENV